MSKFRIYFTILGKEPYYQDVSSPEEAKLVIDSIARFTNFEIDQGAFPDHCNVAGLEEWDEEEQEYLEWYDEEGLGFDEHFNEEE